MSGGPIETELSFTFLTKRNNAFSESESRDVSTSARTPVTNS